MVTLPAILPLASTTPSARNRTANDTTTTALRTSTPIAILMSRTTAFGLDGETENAIVIGLVIWLRSSQVRCFWRSFTTQRYPMQRSLNLTQTPIRRTTATMNPTKPHTSRSLRRPRMRISDSSTLAFGSDARDAYPAWFMEHQIPLSKEEIEGISSWISPRGFGFWEDSLGNMMGTFSVGAKLTRLVAFVPCPSPYLSISLASPCNPLTHGHPECLQIIRLSELPTFYVLNTEK